MNIIDFVSSDCDDLAIHIGATFLVNMQMIQGCGSMAPLDLTGYSATLLVYDETEEDDIIEIDGHIDDPTTGMIRFHAFPNETDDLTAGIYNHSISLSNSENIFKIATGKIEVLA